MSRQLLEVLDGKVAVYTIHGLAVSTTRNLKTHINAYVLFCTKYNLYPFPADGLQMRRYAAHLGDTLKSVDSIKNYISEVRTLHLLMDFPPPPCQEYLYQLTIKGMHRDKAHVVRQAALVTPELLAECAKWVNAADGKELAAWTALLIGFYVMVRKSNLVPDSGATFNPMQQFTRGNFIKTHYGYEARIYWAKTIQFHDRCLVVPVLPNLDLRICPVFWLDVLFGAVPASVVDPAFGYVVKGQYVALSYAQLTAYLKNWAGRCGADEASFSSHSLRRGGCQWAAQCGIPHHVIKLLGDWKSQAYLRYLNMTLQERYDAMTHFIACM